MERILKQFGYVKMKQPLKDEVFSTRKYRVSELDEITTARERANGILVTVANHHTCIRDNYV